MLIGACAGCDELRDSIIPKTARPAAPPPVLNVNVLRVETVNDVSQTAVCFGRFKPQRESQLSFARAGLVKSVSKQTGDPVAKGQMLAELDQAQLEQRQAELEGSLQRAKTSLASASQPEAAQLRPQIQQLESQLQNLDAARAQGVLTAPFDGTVTACNVAEGQPVAAAATAMVIAADEPPLIDVNLPVATAAQIEADQKFWVAVDRTAVVAGIQERLPLPGPVSSERFLLEFDDPPESAAWDYGDVVEVRLLIPTSESGCWIPLAALQRTVGGPWYALSTEVAAETDADKSVVVKRELEIVRIQDDAVLVQFTPDPPGLVIVDGTHRVVPGQTVRAVDVSADFVAPYKQGVTE